MSAQLWYKSRLRLLHETSRGVTLLVRRGSEALLGEVTGHPLSPETHEALAALPGLTDAERRDLRGAVPLAPQWWRKPAA